MMKTSAEALSKLWKVECLAGETNLNAGESSGFRIKGDVNAKSETADKQLPRKGPGGT